MEAFLMEKANLKASSGPVDLAGAQTGARISMKDYKRVAFIVHLGSSAATTPTFNLKQHNAASGGTTKVLSVANPYYHKAGAATSFTKVEPSSAADSYVLTSLFATAAGVVVFEVLAEDLDVNGGFGWVSLDIPAAGAAKLGAVMAVCHEPGSKPAYSLSV